MKNIKCRALSITLIIALMISLFAVLPVSSFATRSVIRADGWFESAYAEWNAVSEADGYNAYVTNAGTDNWTKIDNELIRNNSGTYRVDAVGLKAGEYQIRIVPVIGEVEQTSSAMTTDTLTVLAYDRSGFAHFNYTEGVGAYNDDGTLKENAIVLYVTDETKNTVTVTSKDGTTVTGIGNILGTTGMDVGGGLNSKGGKANENQDILRKLAADGTPLVVRIIGNVKGATGTDLSTAKSEIDGLTAYNSVDYGGSEGDNGFMARMSGGKDVTIEGIGPDAAIDGWGLHFICQSADYAKGYGRSFEVRNLSFVNVPEDCVGMEGQQEDSTLTAPVERCWIHNCTFLAPKIQNPAESDKDGGDGACDFKRGQYFTNSYCYYESYHKTNLVGSSDSSLQYHLTYHHNYWYKCESRGPLARQADIHMYNNVFEGQTSYCMNPRANAYIFSEYNMFINCKNPVTLDSGGVCKSYNNSFASCIGDNNATVVTDKSQTVSSGNKYANFDTDHSLSYIPSSAYVLQTDLAYMKRVVMAYAGAQPTVITSPENVNISVIPSDRKPTSHVTLPYSQSLNKTYISANGTKDNIVFNVSKFNSDSLTVGGSAYGADIVFFVNTSFNVSMTEVSGTYSPTLCNEAGVAIITGTGSAEMLPAGYYIIQSAGYDVGSGKFKEAKIASLTIENAIICDAHTFTDTTFAPTCSSEGYTSHVCTNCGYSYTDSVVEPLEHTFTETIVAPTCSSEGYTSHVCTNCGYSYTDSAVEPLAHTPGTAPTCTEPQICTVCKSVLKSATGHSFSDGICTVCGSDKPVIIGQIHNFTTNGFTDTFFAFTGDQITTGKHGTYTHDFGMGTEDLSHALKFDSNGSVVFTPDADGTLTIAVASSGTDRTILLNGEKIATLTNAKTLAVITVDVEAGVTYTLNRGSGESALYYIAYVPTPNTDDPGTDNPGTDNPGTDNPGTDNPGGEILPKEDCFVGVSLVVGEDLSIRYYVTPSAGKDVADYSVRFTMNGKETVMTGAEKDGAYTFTFYGITPQCMGDSVKAELLLGNSVLDVVEDYSVKQYAKDAMTHLTSDAQYTAISALLSDMLIYGAEAQKYRNYKTDALVTDGLSDVLSPSAYTPNSADKQMRIVTPVGADISLAKFTATGVRFDYSNKIFVKFTTENVDKVNITADGEKLKIIPLGNNEYVAYSNDISATEYGTKVSFELSYEGEHIQTFIYTVNDYVLQKQYDSEIGNLALALYRYGRSALAYKSS